MLKIVVLVSGGGTGLQALINAKQAGEIQNGAFICVISSRSNAFALKRAEQALIPTMVIEKKADQDATVYQETLLAAFEKLQPDLIVLAGFLFILSNDITERFRGRILNVHPSLLPSFGGAGFYGLRVHQAVLDFGVKVTGATVHFVSEQVDGGTIVLQKAVEVLNDDTPHTLQQRVMEQAEWDILPKAVNLFCNGGLSTATLKPHN